MPDPEARPSPPAQPSPELARLAEAYEIATQFHDWRGRPTPASAATLIAVLGSLGIVAETPDDIARSMAGAELDRWRRVLPPCTVVRQGSWMHVPVHVPHGEPVDVWVEMEGGAGARGLWAVDHWVDPRMVDGQLVGEATFAVPGDLPVGYHQLKAWTGGQEYTSSLIVTPYRIELPPALRQGQRWGYLVQLYSLRSRRSWGTGDLVDLADLAGFSGHQLGADFVLVNPLHAAEPTPPLSDSPYLPTTRRFPNPLYLRVEAIAEYAYLDASARRRITTFRTRATKASSDGLLDRDAAWTALQGALRLVHVVPRSIGREAAYKAFRDREGAGLVDFATWCALTTRHGSVTGAWPDDVRDPRGPAVSLAKTELASEIDFFCWLQWVLDDQLAAAAESARDAGMAIGVMHDLAVGVHPDGADAWALADVLATGVSVGAPADEFNQLGQDWSQPPWDPRRLGELAYLPWRDTLRTVLRHAGGLRIDHVMGLFRLWFVPAGRPASEGTYVRFDHDALVGILMLEAQRAGVVVVGEDLGTVEPWVREYLGDRGILGTSLLWFQREADDSPKRPERWRELALATVATHDLPPTTAYLTGEHVELRNRLGLLTRPVEVERAEARAGLADWMALLRELGLLEDGATSAEVVDALHRFLARTPSRLVGIQLVDAVGEQRTQNQPGTFEEYPNWRVLLGDAAGDPVLVEDLPRLLRPPW